jgi:hypothetical protein
VAARGEGDRVCAELARHGIEGELAEPALRRRGAAFEVVVDPADVHRALDLLEAAYRSGHLDRS